MCVNFLHDINWKSSLDIWKGNWSILQTKDFQELLKSVLWEPFSKCFQNVKVLTPDLRVRCDVQEQPECLSIKGYVLPSAYFKTVFSLSKALP